MSPGSDCDLLGTVPLTEGSFLPEHSLKITDSFLIFAQGGASQAALQDEIIILTLLFVPKIWIICRIEVFCWFVQGIRSGGREYHSL